MQFLKENFINFFFFCVGSKIFYKFTIIIVERFFYPIKSNRMDIVMI